MKAPRVDHQANTEADAGIAIGQFLGNRSVAFAS